MKLMHLIADYGPGDLAFAEIVQRLALVAPEHEVMLTRVPPCDTLAAGFCAAKLTLSDGPLDRLIVHDVLTPGPPRAGTERLCFGRTEDGVTVLGANTGWSWSFVVDELSGLCFLELPVERSRAESPRVIAAAVVRVLLRHPHAMCEPVPRASIPSPPVPVVAFVDSGGNLETTVAEPPAPPGAHVRVRIGDVSATALVTERHGTAEDGQLALRPGAAGWRRRDGGERGFVEVFVGGGSAAQRFHRPHTGAPIALEPAPERA